LTIRNKVLLDLTRVRYILLTVIFYDSDMRFGDVRTVSD